MSLFRIKIEPVAAEQWFPGKHVEGVQEIAHDPGDGSTVSNGYGMCGAERVNPGYWIVTLDGRHEAVPPDEFAATYEPIDAPIFTCLKCEQHFTVTECPVCGWQR
jgi:hypothetical protein